MIGNKIKKLRFEKGYTLVQLEQLSGVSYVQIGRYENGKSNPTGRIIKKIADALEVEVEDLIKDERANLDIEVLNTQYEELIKIIESDNESKLVISKIFEAMLFKERIKKMSIKP